MAAAATAGCVRSSSRWCSGCRLSPKREFDRTGWLKLYDSPVALAKGVAVAYVYGMANGLTIAEAMDCSGIEMSGEELAATVAEIVRNGGLELKVRGTDGAKRSQMPIYPQ